MTHDVVVTFQVSRPKDVPRIGQRKTLRVNGRPETLFCKHVDVRMVRDYGEDGYGVVVTFEGSARYALTENTWRGSWND